MNFLPQGKFLSLLKLEYMVNKSPYIGFDRDSENSNFSEP
jgi:hypothetical protein